MQKGFINLGLVVVVVLAAALGYFFILKSHITIAPEPEATPSTVSPTPSANSVFKDLLPFPSKFKWSTAVKSNFGKYRIYDREDFDKPPTLVAIHGYETTSNVSSENFNLGAYYDAKLTDLGWLPDLENTYEGIFENISAYKNDEEHIIFQKLIKYLGAEIPESPYNCPCQYTYKIFITND